MNPQLQFLGAAGEVTGSCHLLAFGRRRVLMDCGLFQGPPEAEDKNRARFPFDPRALDAVVLSHAHLDHSGRLPLLVKQGFRGPIYAHPATRELCRVMLADAAHLGIRDAQTESAKRARRGLPPVAPLYTPDDVDRCLAQFRNLHYRERKPLLPSLHCRLQDAGHILGAAIVEIWLEDGRLHRKLVFSGDLGQSGDFIMPPPQAVEDADLVLLESTYGDRLHRSRAATLAELGEVVAAARRDGGNILIPAFAVGRAQALLYMLANAPPEWRMSEWQIYLDSPMAIQATEVYAAHSTLLAPDAGRYAERSRFLAPNLHFAVTPEQSIAINRMTRGAVIIAGSGMCTGGRILHHFKHQLWREHNHVVFVGYQARGTLGRAIVDGAREITLWNEPIRVAARVHTLGGLSAHADRDELCAWYARFRTRPPVTLIHGEPPALASLAATLRMRYAADCRVPRAGEALDLAQLPHVAAGK